MVKFENVDLNKNKKQEGKHKAENLTSTLEILNNTKKMAEKLASEQEPDLDTLLEKLNSAETILFFNIQDDNQRNKVREEWVNDMDKSLIKLDIVYVTTKTSKGETSEWTTKDMLDYTGEDTDDYFSSF